MRELRRHGMTIGTHGMSHRSWRGMDAVTREAELVIARERIAKVAQAPVDLAACPPGRYDRRLLADPAPARLHPGLHQRPPHRPPCCLATAAAQRPRRGHA